MSQTREERANRKEVYQTPGISRYRTRSAYCLYPGNSFWSVRSSRIVRTTTNAL